MDATCPPNFISKIFVPNVENYSFSDFLCSQQKKKLMRLHSTFCSSANSVKNSFLQKYTINLFQLKA